MWQVDAMEMNSLDMPALLAELGAKYDPERLADALRDRPWDVRKRALRIATTLGTFLTSLLQVGCSVWVWALASGAEQFLLEPLTLQPGCQG